MKLGYTTWGMPQMPIDEAVDRIARLGYDGIEVCVLPGWITEIGTLDHAERKRILKLINDAGLTLSAIAGHAGLLETDPDAHAANVARLQAAIDLALEWQQGDAPPFVNTLSGGRSEDWETQLDFFVERLGPVVDYAARQGVVLAMEPHVHGLIDTPERTLVVLERIDSPYLKVNFDISHFDILGMTTEESVSALIAHSVHTHVKDQRGRVPDYEFLTPGEGDFDYVEYLQVMQAHGYDGFINAEVSKMRQAKPDYDPVAALELSYRTLSQAFEQAGISRR